MTLTCGATRLIIGEMDDHKNNIAKASDAGHECVLVPFLIDAHSDGLVSNEQMMRLSRTFTKHMWNGNTGSGINIGYYLNGNGTINVLSEWPLLSKYDFQVWEIVDTYCNTAWNSHSRKHFGRLAAEILYTVRYGIPRNLRTATLKAPCDAPPGASSEAVIIRWDPPSDYPVGYEAYNTRWPGTRLRFYNIYRKHISDPDWPVTPTLQIAINVTGTGPTWQERNVTPWWQDGTAQAGETYQYKIRTQDWSANITNESFDSEVLTVTYPLMYAGPYPTTQGGLLAVSVPDFAMFHRIPAGSDVTIARGFYFVPYTIFVEAGATLNIDPGVVLTFADSQYISVNGTISAIGDIACENNIVFQGVKDEPGAWWGIYIYATGVHHLAHCIIRNGIENVVLWNEEGLIVECDITYASRIGVIILNAGDGQIIRDSRITHNSWRNVLIWPNRNDPSPVIPIQPLLERCVITHSQNGDGITCIGNSAPDILLCEIRENHRHGIHSELSARKPPSEIRNP